MPHPFRFLGVCIILLATHPLLASSPWDGSWKLNPEKSQMTGGTFTVTLSGKTYHYEDNGLKYEYACDGKDYPVPGDRTISCEETASTLTTTTKGKDGKILWINQHELAPDGKTYKTMRTVMQADGGKAVENATFVRVGAGTGFAGTWKVTSEKMDSPFVVAYKVDGDSMHMELPAFKLTWDGKLDGTPVQLSGPTGSAGFMMSKKAEGPNKIVTVEMTDGKPTDHYEDTLSPDGKTFSEVEWSPDKPNEKVILVFEKQ